MSAPRVVCFALAMLASVAVSPAAAGPSPRVWVVVERGLAQVDLVTGRAAIVVPAAVKWRHAPRLLGRSSDGRVVFALLPHVRGASLVAVEAHTGQLRFKRRLPADAWRYRALVVAPRSGRVLLVANRRGAVWVEARDPSSGVRRARWKLRPANGLVWEVIDAAVASDERQLYVAYHGSGVGGDRFALGAGPPVRCPSAERWKGCLASHGSLVAHDAGGVLASHGDGGIVTRYDPPEFAPVEFDARLDGNHMIDLALDRDSRSLYALGMCGYTGGLTIVTLASTDVRIVAPAGRVEASRTCGQRLAVASNRLLVLGYAAVPPVRPRSGIAVLSADSGRMLRQLNTPGAALDVLAP